MKRSLSLAILVGLLLVAGAAYAQVRFAPFMVNGGGGGSSCSNALDFSNSCNSQYIAVVFR